MSQADVGCSSQSTTAWTTLLSQPLRIIQSSFSEPPLASPTRYIVHTFRPRRVFSLARKNGMSATKHPSASEQLRVRSWCRPPKAFHQETIHSHVRKILL